MKCVLLLILLLAENPTDPIRTQKINRLKKEAEADFKQKNYAEAVKKYRYLTDSLGVEDDAVRLNMAHAYYQLKDTAHTAPAYQSLLAGKQNDIRSVAAQQLGVMAHDKNQLEQALAYFKEALKANPANEQARYDYEIVKKKLDKQNNSKDNQKDDKKKDDKKDNQQDKDKKQNKDEQQNKDEKKNQENKKNESQKQDEKKNEENKKDEKQENKQNDKKDGAQSEQEKQQESERQKDGQPKPEDRKEQQANPMKITQEKAKMILEAMKNQEVQYLQQNRRKSSRPKDKNKPDW